MKLKELFTNHRPRLEVFEILKYIGPGLLVTVGFIDPGNWAANVAAGADFGYSLLWMVTLSTIMLIIIQHNAAHLGIATGLCLSEASTKFLPPWVSKIMLATAMLATIATALAEILGAAIGLNMLSGLPIPIGALLTALGVGIMLFTNSYRKIEKWIIAFVSLIGLAFLVELSLITIDWPLALKSWVIPTLPAGSIPIMMSVLGAVVMPHNIFLHSEIIQSRQWNLESDAIINKQLKYEFYDTFLAMIVGWAINSAMILVAAASFHAQAIKVTDLAQAQTMLIPLLGNAAAMVFAVALLLAGFSSSITACMAGASIFAGIFMEPFDMKDIHSKIGGLLTLIGGLLVLFLLTDPFTGLIWSQIALSIQLPWTVFALIKLTSSEKVMGRFLNPPSHSRSLWAIAIIVTALNMLLLQQIIRQ